MPISHFESLVATIETRAMSYVAAKERFEELRQAVATGKTSWEELRTDEDRLSQRLEEVNPAVCHFFPLPVGEDGSLLR